MFDNIGGKIKTLAKIICWLGIIANVITAIVMFIIAADAWDEEVYIGLGFAFLILGPVISWISSFVLYGFGQLVENSDIIAEQSARNNEKHAKKVQQQREQQIFLVDGTVHCSRRGKEMAELPMQEKPSVVCQS